MGHRELLWVTIGLLACAVALMLGWFSGARDAGVGASQSREAALVLSAILAIACHLYWRASGEAAPVCFGTGAWLLASAHTLTLLGVTDGATGQSLYRSMLLIAPILFIRGILGPQVDTGLQPSRQLAVTVVALVPATVVLVSVSATTSASLATSTLLLAQAWLWASASVLALLRGRRVTTLAPGWIALMAGLYAASYSARFAASLTSTPWDMPTADLLIAGTACAAIGAMFALFRRAIVGRDDAHEARLRAEAAELDEQHTERERAHEVRNALMAIEGASLTLQRNRERLDPQEQHRLDVAVREEIAHLRALIVPEGSEPAALPLWQIAETQAALARARGLRVEVTGDASVHSVGRRHGLIQTLDNLLVNAERHASGRGPAKVTIRVSSTHDTAYLWVEDDGPGIPAEDRHWIFERGRHQGGHPDSEGLGLHVARERIREQGGELRLAPRGGGGAAFLISLPRYDAVIAAGPPDVAQAAADRAAAIADEPAPRLSSKRVFRLISTGRTRAAVSPPPTNKVKYDDPLADEPGLTESA